jgi:hypothetical protein
MVNPAIQDKRPYVEIRPKSGGPWAVCQTQAEAVDMADGNVDEYEIREKWMTPNEFEKLKEFQGW